jgi:hypothetical protein
VEVIKLFDVSVVLLSPQMRERPTNSATASTKAAVSKADGVQYKTVQKYD